MVEAFFLQKERYFIDALSREVIDDGFRLYVAEHTDLSLHIRRECLHSTADDDIRLDSDGAQLLDGVLGRLCLEFVSGFDVWYECDVNIDDVISIRYVFLDLTDGFEEWQGLDITDGATDLRDDDVCIVISADTEHAVFDLVCDMRNDLNGGA